MTMYTVNDYIDSFFAEGSRPSETTVKNWIKRNRLPHRVVRIGRKVYIDVRTHNTGNPLVDKVLNEP